MKRGDSGDLSEDSSSYRKDTVSSSIKRGPFPDNSMSYDSRGSLVSALYERESSIRKKVPHNINSVVTPLNKSSTSKLSGSSASLTMSNTSEGVIYRSAYLNMVNVNNRGNNPRLIPASRNFLFGEKKNLRSSEAYKKNTISAQTKPKTTKGANSQDQKDQIKVKVQPPCEERISIKVDRSSFQRTTDDSKGFTIQVVKASDKQSVKIETDYVFLECDETLNVQTASNRSQSNHSNTTLLVNPLTLYCDESLEPASSVGKGTRRDADKIRSSAKKLNFEPKVEAKSQPVKSLTVEEEVKKWAKESNLNDISQEIYENMLVNECISYPDAHYFDTKQTEINWIMRAVLIDWMIEVSEEFSLKRCTLQLAVSYVDRYLSLVANLQKSQLQLVGTTALFIAMKFEVT